MEPGMESELGLLAEQALQQMLQKNQGVAGEITRLAQTSPQTGQPKA